MIANEHVASVSGDAMLTYLLLDKISDRVMTPCYGNIINNGVSANLGIKHHVELNVNCLYVIYYGKGKGST